MMMRVVGDGPLARAIRANIGNRLLDLVWIAYDTPVNERGEAATEWVIDQAFDALRHTPEGTRVLISSQLPIGTCARFETWFPHLSFAVNPENLRTATAEEDFRHQPRVVIGTRHAADESFYMLLFKPFTGRILFVSPESAEMVKHALNGFLALSIEFAHEIAVLAVKHGADARQVMEAVMADPRIGRDAYLKPDGEPGPHLLREVRNLVELGGGPLIDAMGVR